MPIIYDKKLKMARAIVNRHEFTSEELQKARRMAQDGYSIGEIISALGLNISNSSANTKLKKYNIFSRRRGSGIGKKFGIDNCKSVDTDMRIYKSKNNS